MQPAHVQNTPANLAAVLAGVDDDARDAFFRNNELLHYLINRHGGERFEDDLYEEIYNETCVEILRAAPDAYDPTFQPGTFLGNRVREARRTVLRRQHVIDRPRTASPADVPSVVCCGDTLEELPVAGTTVGEMDDTVSVKQILAMAPPLVAELLISEYFEGHTFKEACERAGIERTRGYREVRAFKQSLN